MPNSLDHAGLKALSKELSRPLFTLEVLRNDPFTADSPDEGNAPLFASTREYAAALSAAHTRRASSAKL
jgi:hypothetical protein